MRPLTFSWMVVGMQCAAYFAAALENGVGRVPAMGWNSWNTFRCEITEDVIKVRLQVPGPASERSHSPDSHGPLGASRRWRMPW